MALFCRAAWTLILVALEVPAVPQFEALLRRSDVGAFAPASFRAQLTFSPDDRQSGNEIEIWRSGQDRTLVRLLAPADRGKYLLRLGRDLWFLAPGARNPVRLGATHRIYGAVTIDLLLGLRLSEDYVVSGSERRQDREGATVAFELRARTPDQQFASVSYVVRESTALPVSARYRLASGRDAALIDFVEWTSAPRVAREMRVHDLLRKNAVTRIRVTEFEERAVSDKLFDLHDSSARRALEAGGSARVSPRAF